MHFSSSSKSKSPATSSGSTTTQTRPAQQQVQQGSRIHTVITERFGQSYTGEPEDMGVPEFARSGSFYHTHASLRPQDRYYQASDVRRQVREAPAIDRAVARRYPGVYHNQPPLPLRANPPLREFPIASNPQNGLPPRNYTGGPPGPTRAIYNPSDRSRFDVAYHDPSQAPRGPRNGSAHVNTDYGLATYHPAPTYTDVSTVKKHHS